LLANSLFSANYHPDNGGRSTPEEKAEVSHIETIDSSNKAREEKTDAAFTSADYIEQERDAPMTFARMMSLIAMAFCE
jgi:hypothetical protein